jgi:hypothetical protein
VPDSPLPWAVDLWGMRGQLGVVSRMRFWSRDSSVSRERAMPGGLQGGRHAVRPPKRWVSASPRRRHDTPRRRARGTRAVDSPRPVRPPRDPQPPRPRPRRAHAPARRLPAPLHPTAATARASAALLQRHRPARRIAARSRASSTTAIDEPALERLSEGRAYLASDADALSGAFAAVADDLGAIYRHRVLVAEVGADARATIAIDYGSRNLRTSFDLASITGDGGGGDGGSAPGDPMVPVDPPSTTCTRPCTLSEECEPGEACLDTTEGNLCMPESCGGCFELGLTCNYYADQCTFSECV